MQCNATIRIGKAASVFGRLVNIWKSKNISLAMQIRLYESLVISNMLYGAESWLLCHTNEKKLEAIHHKCQRRLSWITWRDKVRNEDIRKKTGSRKLEDIIKERRLRWLGHVLRVDNSRTARQATHWELRGYKRKPGPPTRLIIRLCSSQQPNLHQCGLLLPVAVISDTAYTESQCSQEYIGL